MFNWNRLHIKRRKKFNFQNKKFIFGVLVFAVLFVVLLISFPDVDKNAKLTANQLISLADNIRNHYKIKPNYWGLNTAYALENNIIPASMLRNGKIINELGQPVLIGFGKNGDTVMPGVRGFDIIFENVNKKACMLLMSHSFDNEQKLALNNITLLNSQEVAFSWSGEYVFPLSLLEARKMCENKNKIIWSFE